MIKFPVPIGENNKIVIIGGINVLETIDLAYEVANEFKRTCEILKLPYIFKASFDKANRSSIDSYRGPGLEKGLKMLKEIKETLKVPILTDIHEPFQAKEAEKICDVLQLPAFLARQTDLVQALASTGKPIHIKKPQFLSPEQVGPIVEKFSRLGCEDVVVCERGTNFGYDNQIVDLLGLEIMRKASKNKPISFDITHSLQFRKNGSDVSDGRGEHALILAKGVVATGIDALFIEAHTDPKKALCDGPSALATKLICPFLSQIEEIDSLVKSQHKFTKQAKK